MQDFENATPIHTPSNPWNELQSHGVEFYHTSYYFQPYIFIILFRFDKYESRLYCISQGIEYETESRPFDQSQRKVIHRAGTERFKKKLGKHKKIMPDGTQLCGYTKYV